MKVQSTMTDEELLEWEKRVSNGTLFKESKHATYSVAVHQKCSCKDCATYRLSRSATQAERYRAWQKSVMESDSYPHNSTRYRAGCRCSECRADAAYTRRYYRRLASKRNQK